jgi:hypothetical protein
MISLPELQVQRTLEVRRTLPYSYRRASMGRRLAARQAG